jgi:hypothetical protein
MPEELLPEEVMLRLEKEMLEIEDEDEDEENLMP